MFLFNLVPTLSDSSFITLYHQCLWCKVNTYLIKTRVLYSVNNNITKNAFLIIYSFYFPLLFIVTTFLFSSKSKHNNFTQWAGEVAIFFYLIGFLLVHILVYVYVIYAFSYLLMCMCVYYCRRKIHFSCVYISWVFVAFLIDILTEDKNEKTCRKCNCIKYSWRTFGFSINLFIIIFLQYDENNFQINKNMKICKFDENVWLLRLDFILKILWMKLLLSTNFSINYQIFVGNFDGIARVCHPAAVKG